MIEGNQEKNMEEHCLLTCSQFYLPRDGITTVNCALLHEVSIKKMLHGYIYKQIY